MKIHEPATLVTDYLLGGLAAFLGARLLRAARGPGRRGTRLWGWALIATAVAAFAGGTWHGFAPEWSAGAAAVLWKTTLFAVGGASAAMLAGSAVSTLQRPWQGVVLAVVVSKLAAYLAWMAFHDEFRYVIYDYAPALLAVLVLHAAALRRREPGAAWIVGGVLISFLAAAVQALGIAPHPRFNHNDLYHVVQMAALVLLARGARDLRDRM
jgi:hypothetical protein